MSGDSEIILEDYIFLQPAIEDLRASSRQLQKIAKEFGPVNTALAALLTRETMTPDPAACAASLRKIKGRLDAIRTKHLKYAEEVREKQLIVERKAGFLAKLTPQQRKTLLVVDFLAFKGLTASATAFAASAGLNDFLPAMLSDKDTVQTAVAGLENQSVVEAIDWCRHNKQQLSKVNTTIEVELYVQEIIELIRQRNHEEAVEKARQNLAPLCEQYTEQVSLAMACMAFPPSTNVRRYADMYSAERWKALIALLKEVSRRVLRLPRLLELVRSGIVAIHAPSSMRRTDINDPLNNPAVLQLAIGLPATTRMSVLRCPIARCPMLSDNSPMVFPSGFVCSKLGVNMLQYSEEPHPPSGPSADVKSDDAAADDADQEDEMVRAGSKRLRSRHSETALVEKVVCPLSNKVYKVSELRKAIIL